MNATLSPDIVEILAAPHYRPAISIIMPFDPKTSLKNELLQKLKFASDKVARELKNDYPREVVDLLSRKLKGLLNQINVNSHNKSLVVYISPVFEKIIYLDITVNEKIIIDDSFEIRDLVVAKKAEQKFICLLVSSKYRKIFLGNSTDLVNIKTGLPGNINSLKRDLPEKVVNFTEATAIKQSLLKKFLHHTDEELKDLIKAYSLPVFVIGTKKTLGYFKAMTKNQGNIAGYISGNYETQSESELVHLIKPFIDIWKSQTSEKIYEDLEKAAGAGKLVTGIQAVWKQVTRGKGKLLVVERNYTSPAQLGSQKDTIEKLEEPYNRFSYIRDPVDDIIERVLESGGDIEFVNDGSLKKYMNIALVPYY